MTRTVLYVEVPGFYAAVERAADPTLAERPVIVGGDPRKRGLVQAATLDACAAGVKVGMPVLDALERCPKARALRTRMPYYRDSATKLRATLRRVAEAFEPDGLEAAFLDASERAAEAHALCLGLRRAVAAELGLPLLAGIAPLRLLARLAAREAGPEGVGRVAAGQEAAFLGPLAPGRLPFLGPNAELRLGQAGARTIAEAVALGRDRLEELLGNRARELLDLVEGRGDARVRAERQPRSIGQEATLDTPAQDAAALRQEVERLVARLEAALRLQGLGARKITLKLRYEGSQTVTRSMTLLRALSQREDLEAAALDLLSRTDAGERPVRLVGLLLGRLGRSRRDVRQLDLFSSGR